MQIERDLDRLDAGFCCFAILIGSIPDGGGKQARFRLMPRRAKWEAFKPFWTVSIARIFMVRLQDTIEFSLEFLWRRDPRGAFELPCRRERASTSFNRLHDRAAILGDSRGARCEKLLLRRIAGESDQA
jgi:hypothetical protein